ncbi:uncharacterized protein LOC125664488 isoform X2 [Ostrea edulis]|nr:uncharacterized protein LOC125664488 isoform X2 [Ostrea edulis]
MESTGKFTKRPYDIGREESWTHSLDYISGIFILHIVLIVSIFGLVFAAFYTAWKIRILFGIIKDYRKTKSDACIRYRTRESGRISQYNGLGYQSAVDGGSDYILPVSVGQIEQYRNIV